MARKFVMKARGPVGGVDFAAELNDEQLKVATAPGGPMLVIAGAGTGKTRALTYRLAYLVSAGVDPSRLLLVTFTNRAAREMLSRVGGLIHENANRIWGGTFHHIANRLLRQHGQVLGIEPDFTILDREDARDLIASCVTDANVDTTARRFPRKAVLSSISSFRQNTLESLEQVLVGRYPMFVNDHDNIARVLDLYVQRKRDRQLMDYDDLLTAWLLLLNEHDSVREMLAEQFQHVLVDEYQDTNAIQGTILDLLAGHWRNLCVVGDDSQSIYSFRGANFENILHFKQRYPDCHEHRLETNYRSTPEILALANLNIEQNEQRLPKELRAVRASGLKPSLVTCHDHFVQTRFIAEYILHLLDEGRVLTDIAVLYRAHWHSLEIQLELQRRNIPFQVRGGLRFFEQAHIKDVLCYLRIVQNPSDELAWRRVLRLLPRIGGVLSQRLWEHIAQSPDPIASAQQDGASALLPVPARKFYTQFTNMLGALAALKSPSDMIGRLMDDFYDDYLVSHFDGANLRREDINGLSDFASQYDTLEAFLSDVALAGDFSGETVETGPDEMHFVTLSTVHAAKGLEWPIVLIPWLADGRFPTDMAINTPEELEEERRVFHVAITRAKDELYLAVPQVWRSDRKGRILMKPSRFLMELPSDVTEPMELAESLPEVTSGKAVTGRSEMTPPGDVPRLDTES